MWLKHRVWVGISIAVLTGSLIPNAAAASNPFTLEQILGPAFPYELVAARNADRIAWIAYERGLRNIYTATGPDFKPVRLTDNNEDDGNDLTGLSISDNGETVAYVRGHTPNSTGWVANPASDPKGAERATWAVKTRGDQPRKVALTGNPLLSPDGHWVLFLKDGQFYRAAVDHRDAHSDVDKGEKPFFVVYGVNSNPHWSPDGTKIAFVSDRTDHSFIGVYDLAQQKISYLAPSVDHDSSPTWSPDGRQLAFIRRPGTPFGQQERGGNRGAQPARGRRGAPQPPTPPAQPQTRGTPANAAGLTRGILPGGSTLAFYVADVATGNAREFWHNAPDERTFTTINNIQWTGGVVLFSRQTEEWPRYYTVPVASGAWDPLESTCRHASLSIL